MNHPRLAHLGKWSGVLSSTAALVLSLMIIYYKQAQYSPGTGIEGTWVIGKWVLDAVDIKLVLLDLAGILTSLFKKPLLMILVFILQFIPVGLYLLGVPSWGRLFGMANLLFLVSSFLILLTRYRIQKIQDAS